MKSCHENNTGVRKLPYFKWQTWRINAWGNSKRQPLRNYDTSNFSCREDEDTGLECDSSP